MPTDTETGIEYLTVGQVATILGVTRQRVHQIIIDYDINVEKVGDAPLFLIRKTEFRRLQQLRKIKTSS